METQTQGETNTVPRSIAERAAAVVLGLAMLAVSAVFGTLSVAALARGFNR